MTTINWKTKKGVPPVDVNHLVEITQFDIPKPTVSEQLQRYAPYALGALALLLLIRK